MRYIVVITLILVLTYVMFVRPSKPCDLMPTLTQDQRANKALCEMGEYRVKMENSK